MADRIPQKRPGRSEANLTKLDLAKINDWFLDGMSVRDVVELTGPVLGKPKNERQVYRYQRRFKEWKARKEREATDSEFRDEEPVTWVALRAVMSSLGISRETLPVIRAAWGWAEWAYYGNPPALTHRSAKWYAYVLDYAPSIRLPIDIWAIGEQYAFRDFHGYLFTKSVERSDLDAWLTYQPWLDREKEARYLDAVKDGTAPELRDRDPEMKIKLTRGRIPPSEDTGRRIVPALLSSLLCRLVPEKRHQLPSWQLDYLASNPSADSRRPLVAEITLGNMKMKPIRLG